MRQALRGMMVLMLLAGVVRGQQTGVVTAVPSDGVGVGGHVQPGQWAPLQLRITNQSAELRGVVARWLVTDEDGDEVFAERAAPLNPGVEQNVWLYAPIPMTLPSQAAWTVQVIDAESRLELARQRVTPAVVAGVTETLIGVCGSVDMGLRDYEPSYTRHEATRFVRGLLLSNLPDRWYGLAALHALIWTSEAANPLNDPADASVTPQVADAVRQWVRRGGHLVIVLPVDQTWSDSPLADLMPVSKDRIRRVDDFDPFMLGALPPDQMGATIPALTFDVDGLDGVSVVAVGRQKEPYIVARRVGFGRVTLVGVDLDNAAIRRLGIPNGQYRLWNRVFNWASPVMTEAVYESEVREGKIVSTMSRQGRGSRLDDLVSGQTAMTGTAAPALLAAILVFALYWVLAGPVAFVVLKNRGRSEHAWLAFVALSGVFTVVTWGGAWLMRPAHTQLEHVTVLDIDANTATVHTRSWLTLLVPRFGTATVALDPDEAYAGQVIASPGMDTRTPGGEFLDPQQYTVAAADPRAVDIPVRSTAKRFTLDYLGRLDDAFDGVTDEWLLPGGQIRMDDQDAWPVAKLTHGLPGELRHVLVIYCPGTLTVSGEPRSPWVGYLPRWGAGETLELTSPPAMPMTPLVMRPPEYGPQRLWEAEGYLGQLVGETRGRSVDPNQPLQVRSIGDANALRLVLLSFFDALPPPDYRNTSLATSLQPVHFERTLLRPADMTHLLTGRRLILVGLLDDSPLPAPLTLDEEPVPAHGLTLVRWVYDL